MITDGQTDRQYETVITIIRCPVGSGILRSLDLLSACMLDLTVCQTALPDKNRSAPLEQATRKGVYSESELLAMWQHRLDTGVYSS